nr:hypothetical protein Iba_chr12fCG15980 [Ipomoea batatas]
MEGPFILNIGFATAARSNTSRRVCCSNPLLSASTSPSENAFIMLPITMLTTSFIFAPFPTCPRKKDFFPKTSKAGST